MEHRTRSKAASDAGKIMEPWGSLTWLASDALTQSEITVGRVIIKPGMANPRHAHDTCEEVLYLLQGELTHSLEDGTIEMAAGDTLVVPPGVMHNAVNHGEADADMIVAYSNGVRDFRKEG
jgi:quercetin dioxygenase-like cupin family protein